MPNDGRLVNVKVDSENNKPTAKRWAYRIVSKSILSAESRHFHEGLGLEIFLVARNPGVARVVPLEVVVLGREELVRGVELVGTPLSSVNKLLATSVETRVFNGFCGAESGYVPVSTVAPATLISEIELQRVARANERSPILPAPWSEGARKP